MRKFIKFICYLSLHLPLYVFGQQALPADIEQHTKQINQYYDAENADYPFDEVTVLATKIVPERVKYSVNTMAKIYALLAEIATVRGESSRAHQLALYGLTYKPIDEEIELNLKLKLVTGYFFNNQYVDVIELIEDVINSAKLEENDTYHMQALAYRAMANALLGNHEKALNDLLTVEKIIDSNHELSDYIELNEILAVSQHYLGNNETALSLYEKILNQRFSTNKERGIESTYVQLADVYLSMGSLDDAYNAYWEAKRYAITFQLPIRIAYAELGLGRVLLKQGQYERAFKSLVEAESLFKGQSLNAPYLDTLISLIIASQKTGRHEFADNILERANEVTHTTKVTIEQAGIYLLLADYYKRMAENSRAFSMQQRYIDMLQQQNKNNHMKNMLVADELNPVEQTKIQTLKVAEISENKQLASEQSARISQVMLLLALTSVFFFIVIVYQWLKIRSQRLRYEYDQNERPSYELPQPVKTKQLYHRVYKKARKYEYPVSVGYIQVKNWQDLSFQYNKKVVSEVAKTIATIINEHIGEFDYAGMINDGEYLLMFPHQKNDESLKKMDKLVEALNVRFFANLGEFSVNIGFSIDSPTIQDIDPYIFLSRLIEA